MKKSLILLSLSLFSLIGCSTKDTFVSEGKENNYHVVSFNTNGGSFVPAQKVLDNEFATAPLRPIKQDYKFDDWYLDSECKGEPFDFTNYPIREDTKLYANWKKNYYTFSFKSPYKTCSINGQFEFSQRVPIGATNVKFLVTATNPDYDLPEYSYKGIKYELGENLNYAVITIENMNHDYQISLDAHHVQTYKFEFNGEGKLLIDGKSNLIETFKAGEVDKTYYIKPLENYDIPTLEELGLDDIGDSIITYRSGVLTINDIYSDIVINDPNPSHRGYKTSIISNGGTFKILNEGIMSEYANTYNGVIKIENLDKGKIKLNFKLEDKYSIKKDDVLLHIDNKVITDFDFEKQDDGSFNITIGNIDGDIVLNILANPELTKTVKFIFSAKDAYEQDFDVYVKNTPLDRTEDEVEIKVPNDDKIDYFVQVDVKVNDYCSYKATNLDNYCITDENNVPIQNISFKDGAENAKFLINLKGVESVVNFKLTEGCLEKRLLEDCSFNAIGCISKLPEDRLRDYFPIGTTKNIYLSEDGELQPFPHRIRVVSYYHDTLDGDPEGKKAGITFDFADLITKVNDRVFTKKWDIIDHDFFVRYDESKIAEFLEGEFLQMVPEDLLNNTKTVRKRIYDEYHHHYEHAAQYYIPSNKELNASGTGGFSDDKKFDYYTNNSSRKKRNVKSNLNSDDNMYYTNIMEYSSFDNNTNLTVISDDGGSMPAFAPRDQYHNLQMAPAFNI